MPKQSRSEVEHEIWGVFDAPDWMIETVEEHLTSGPKTLAQLRKRKKGGNYHEESIMDCLSVLVDRGRITASYNADGDRLYSQKAQPNPSNLSREMALLQRGHSDSPIYWATDIRPTTYSTRSESYN